MKNKKLIILISLVIILVLISIFITAGDYADSVRLSKAIDAGDKAEVERIVDAHPSCVNSVPALLPEWVYSVTDVPRPAYSLYRACLSDDPEIVEILLNAGADPDGIEGCVPLSAVYIGKTEHWYEISQMLIDKGASVDYFTSNSGGTAFILEDIVQRAYDKDYGDEDEENVYSAFVYAFDNCDHGIVDWNRVWQESVSCDRIKIVGFLIGKGYFDPAAQTGDMSPLMFTARDSSAEMVRFLIDHGADRSIKDEYGRTAYDYAVERGDPEIMELLK